jgi:hypothetical protein
MLMIAGLLAVLVVMLTATNASAATRSVADNPAFTGWGHVEFGRGDIRFPAYSWSDNRWHTTYRQDGTAVYIAPYTGGWSWTWSVNRGWLAMRSSNLRYIA